jgi:hypothetical protein
MFERGEREAAHVEGRAEIVVVVHSVRYCKLRVTDVQVRSCLVHEENKIVEAQIF